MQWEIMENNGTRLEKCGNLPLLSHGWRPSRDQAVCKQPVDNDGD
jgi:hypothetical protein